jgi:hypothetical protein
MITRILLTLVSFRRKRNTNAIPLKRWVKQKACLPAGRRNTPQKVAYLPIQLRQVPAQYLRKKRALGYPISQGAD